MRPYISQNFVNAIKPVRSIALAMPVCHRPRTPAGAVRPLAFQKPSLVPVSLQPRTTPGQVCYAEVGVQPQHLVKVPDGALIVAQLCRGDAWHIWQ